MKGAVLGFCPSSRGGSLGQGCRAGPCLTTGSAGPPAFHPKTDVTCSISKGLLQLHISHLNCVWGEMAEADLPLSIALLPLSTMRPFPRTLGVTGLRRVRRVLSPSAGAGSLLRQMGSGTVRRWHSQRPGRWVLQQGHRRRRVFGKHCCRARLPAVPDGEARPPLFVERREEEEAVVERREGRAFSLPRCPVPPEAWAPLRSGSAR